MPRREDFWNRNELDSLYGEISDEEFEIMVQDEALSRNFKRLAKDYMDPDAGRTNKWKTLYLSVKNIDESQLDDPDYCERTLTEICQNTFAYTKGKKSVRKSTDGQKRFDQALDVMAELSRVSETAWDTAQNLFDRVNEVRWGHDPFAERVIAENYGVEFAEDHRNPNVPRPQEQEAQNDGPEPGGVL